MSSVLSDYFAKGVIIIPENISGVPLVSWKGKTLSLEFLRSAEKIDCNYGVLTGEISGVIGLDIDTNDPVIIGKIEQRAGISPVKRIGSKGYCAFYKYNDEGNKSWRINGKVVAEIKSNGGKMTIPPSIHRTTKKPYYWVNEADSLLNRINDLPLLKANFFQEMANLFEGAKQVEVGELMSYIPFPTNYDDWIQVGMALHNATHGKRMDLWDAWSRGGESYKGTNDLKTHWNSFRSNGGYTIGSLIMWAKEGGYVSPELREQEEAVAKLKEEITPKKEVILKNPLELLSNAPNFLGKIARSIEDSNRMPHPMYAIGASIALMGVLASRNFCSPIARGKLNMFCMGIGGSGSGKESSMVATQEILDRAGVGWLMMPMLGTHQAIHKAVANMKGDVVRGKCICLIDEYGAYIENTRDRNSSGNRKAIGDKLMSVFTSSIWQSELILTERDEKLPPVIMPSFNIWTVTTAGKIFDALSTKDLESGSLNRWLLFKDEQDYPLAEDKEYKRLDIDMLDFVRMLGEMNIQDAWNPMPLVFADGVKQRFLDYEREIRLEVQKTHNTMLVRKAEAMLKIACLASVDPSNQKTTTDGEITYMISHKEMDWAIDLIEKIYEFIMHASSEAIADTPFQRNRQLVLKKIRQNAKFDKEENRVVYRVWLDQQLGGMFKKKEVDELLESLISTQTIKIEKGGVKIILRGK